VQGATGAKPTGKIFLTAAGMWPTTTSGAATPAKVETTTNDVNYYSMDFADGSTLAGMAQVAMPSDWDAGTITAQFFWAADSASANSVVWDCAAMALADSDALDTAFGTAVTVTDANNAQLDLNISAATAAITVGNSPAAGELVFFRIRRVGGDGSDTLAATARLLGVMITFTRT
jgi:hypothetical protein